MAVDAAMADGDEPKEESGEGVYADRARVLPAEINGGASVSLKFPAYCRRSAAVDDPRSHHQPLCEGGGWETGERRRGREGGRAPMGYGDGDASLATPRR